jgi:hypothetical protein
VDERVEVTAETNKLLSEAQIAATSNIIIIIIIT